MYSVVASCVKGTGSHFDDSDQCAAIQSKCSAAHPQPAAASVLLGLF